MCTSQCALIDKLPESEDADYFSGSRLSGSGLKIKYSMSVSSSLHQWGVCPGMMTTSPFVTRRETPPSMPGLRALVPSIAGPGGLSVPPVTSVAPSSMPVWM